MKEQYFVNRIKEKYIKNAVKEFIARPCCKTWDNVHAIHLWNRQTVWQMVCRVDPSFPSVGPGYIHNEEAKTFTQVSTWLRIPEPSIVLRALMLAFQESNKTHLRVAACRG